MAVRMLSVIVDDYDGTELKPGHGKTISFSLEGTAYEIDLSDKNAKKFTRELEPWIAKAHRPTGTPSEPRGRSRAHARARSAIERETKSHNRAVREWAQQNGLPVSARGRIANTILESYAARH